MFVSSTLDGEVYAAAGFPRSGGGGLITTVSKYKTGPPILLHSRVSGVDFKLCNFLSPKFS